MCDSGRTYGEHGECYDCTVMGCPYRDSSYTSWDSHDERDNDQYRNDDMYHPCDCDECRIRRARIADCKRIRKSNGVDKEYDDAYDDDDHGWGDIPEKEHYKWEKAEPEHKPLFHVRLKWYTAYKTIGHPVDYYENDARNYEHCYDLALQKFPSADPDTIMITEGEN